MWCFCDDAGRHTGNTKRLKMEVFPGDSFTDKEVRGFIDELIRVGLLVEYEHENTMFWQVTGWKKHQKIDRPSYKHGPFDSHGNPIDPPAIRRAFDEHSTSTRRTPPPGEEGKGKEGRGEEGNGMDVCGFGEDSPNPPAFELQPAKPQVTDFRFVVCDGTEWRLSARKYAEYRQSFPELELDAELRKAGQWTRDNPKKRKTANGMHAFIGRWLGAEQNRPKPTDSKTTAGYFMTDAQKKLHNSELAGQNFLEKMGGLANTNGKALGNGSK
jgi:hypothetical protein